VKVRRTVWIEAEHPRDRKGRFIEKGATVRVWGGFLGKVINNIGGGRIEIERLTDGKHVIVHRNYLTVVARPDGSAPTDKRDDNPASLTEAAASPDAEQAPEPTVAPDVDAHAESANAFDVLVGLGDQENADLLRQAARDYQSALGNGVPDDEADERDGLLQVIEDVEAQWADSPDGETLAEALVLIRDAAEAEPPAEGSDHQPTRHRVARSVARGAEDAAEGHEGDAGFAVDGEVVTVHDPAKASVVLADYAQVNHTLSTLDALPESMRGQSRALAIGLGGLVEEINGIKPLTFADARAIALGNDAKPVYTGSNERSGDEQVPGDGRGPLEGAPSEGVQVDQEPPAVLRGPGSRDGATDRGPGGGAAGSGPGERGLPDEGRPVPDGAAERGVADRPGGAAAPGGADGGDGVRDRVGGPGADAGVGGLPDGARGTAGREGRPDGVAPLTLVPGQEVFWQNPDPESFIGTRRGRFSHYGDGGATAYFDYDKPLTAAERRARSRRRPVQRQQANTADLYAANPDAPSAAEVEWRTRNEPGYTPPTAAEDLIPNGTPVIGRSTNADGLRNSWRGEMAGYSDTGKPKINAWLEDGGRNGRWRVFEVDTVERADTPADDGDTVTLSQAEVDSMLAGLNSISEADLEGPDGEALVRDALRPDFDAIDSAEQDRIDAERVAERERQRIRDNFDLYGSPEIPTDADLAAEADARPTPAAPEDIEDYRAQRAAEGNPVPPAPSLADVPEDDHEPYTPGPAPVRSNDPSVPAAPEDIEDARARRAAEGNPVPPAPSSGSPALTDAQHEVYQAEIDKARAQYGNVAPEDMEAARAIALASPAEEPLPDLPEDWNDLEPGTRIRVGFEESAHDGTFLRTDRSSFGTGVVVTYRHDDGTEDQFMPTRGEKPRAARPNPVVASLVRQIRASEVIETGADGMVLSVLSSTRPTRASSTSPPSTARTSKCAPPWTAGAARSTSARTTRWCRSPTWTRRWSSTSCTTS
jgi:hypothetical protein